MKSKKPMILWIRKEYKKDGDWVPCCGFVGLSWSSTSIAKIVAREFLKTPLDAGLCRILPWGRYPAGNIDLKYLIKYLNTL